MIKSNRWLLAACAAVVFVAPAPSLAQQPPEALRPVIPTNLTPYTVAIYSPKAGAARMGLEVAQAHLTFIKAQIAAGTIRFAGPMQDGPAIGIMVLSTPDRATAQALLDRDPMVSGGFVEVRIQGAMLPSLDAVQVPYPS